MGWSSQRWANEVKIDVAIAWLGNELVAERGLFLNPASMSGARNTTVHMLREAIGKRSLTGYAPH